QKELFREFKILAIDHPDLHSPEVLKELLFLLRHGFPPGTMKDLKDIRYLFAFSGHDPQENSAAYHRVAHAISVGGIKSFNHPLPLAGRIHLLGTLAHEIGHAFVFENMSPGEL